MQSVCLQPKVYSVFPNERIAFKKFLRKRNKQRNNQSNFQCCLGGVGQQDVVINKTPVLIESQEAGLSLDLYKYLLDHTREPEIMARVRIETAEQFGKGSSAMQVTPEQGQFLSMLVKASGAKKAIELGVFTGYSTLAIGLALPQDGTLIAIDRDERSMTFAEKFWTQAGLSSLITKQLGKGQEILDKLLQEEGEGSYDFAFMDADKRAQEGYFEQLIKLIKVGGLIVVDNVLWHGRVANPSNNDKNTVAIRNLNDKLFSDERIDLSIVPVGDGIAICRKL
eukprot:TRINITY_DN36206_c0_g1_i3.p1 TRINITY_DN36206_c0_g1~~TRINITY_DN36206_c0_g1_i3.p1  ORF type:complete len:311 (+),score=45.59 TRINITY_DN36206_c0_g1_i3:93-935(+)